MPSTYASLSYHFVFSTKDRQPLLDHAWRQRLFDYFGGCLRKSKGVLIEMDGTSDHVHLLAGLRPTHRVSDALCDLKHATSVWIHEAIGLRAFHWQEGYAAFTVSPYDCGDLVRYIRSQEEHHRKRTFREELQTLLVQHGIEFDERYLL